MNPAVYDADALIAADRNDREFWAEHRLRVEAGALPVAPAVVVAQVSRSPRQVQLRRLLRGCEITVLDEQAAHRAGALLRRARSSDVADAVVVLSAPGDAEIVTGDRPDIARLLSAAGSTARIVDV